jgi:hypothetical protein
MSGGHGRFPNPRIPNPQTLRPQASTAARARRRPAVGRPAHQPLELEKMTIVRVTFFYFILLLSLSGFFSF